MTKAKKAYIFLFTNWHVSGPKKERPENWPPFCNATPPDKRPFRELIEDIHTRRDKLLPKNFPDEEKMELRTSGSGPEDIDTKGEPKWETVWGVIVDRNSISPGPNSDKLTSMAIRLKKAALAVRRYPVDLFITPRGDQETPAPLKRYEDSFVVQIVDTSEEFSAAVAGALVQSSQRLDQAVVRHVNDSY